MYYVDLCGKKAERVFTASILYELSSSNNEYDLSGSNNQVAAGNHLEVRAGLSADHHDWVFWVEVTPRDTTRDPTTILIRENMRLQKTDDPLLYSRLILEAAGEWIRRRGQPGPDMVTVTTWLDGIAGMLSDQAARSRQDDPESSQETQRGRRCVWTHVKATKNPRGRRSV